MFKFSVQQDVESKARELSEKLRRQLPFAIATAMTRTAQAVHGAQRTEVGTSFDRPTPWTLNSMRVVPATKARLEASVEFRDVRSKGTHYEAALRHEITGGARPWKRSERLLQRIGALGQDEAAVPGKAAELDSYGNMSRGKIVQLLAYLQAFGEQGYRANMTSKGRARLAKMHRRGGYATIGGVQYFVSRGKGNWFGGRSWKHGRAQHLPPGVWARSAIHGVRVRPVLMFVRRPSYSVRWRFYDVGRRVAAATFRHEFDRAIDDAMRTAR